MSSEQSGYQKVLLQNVVETFDQFIGQVGEHAMKTETELYQQPYVYVSFHLIQAVVAGWDVNFDTLTAVSGASALFGYQPGEFMPKYAHLSVGADQRIADAVGVELPEELSESAVVVFNAEMVGDLPPLVVESATDDGAGDG